MCSSRAERSLQTRQRGPGHDDEALGALERCAAQPGLDVPVGGEQERAGRPKSASLEQACIYPAQHLTCPRLPHSSKIGASLALFAFQDYPQAKFYLFSKQLLLTTALTWPCATLHSVAQPHRPAGCRKGVASALSRQRHCLAALWGSRPAPARGPSGRAAVGGCPRLALCIGHAAAEAVI